MLTRFAIVALLLVAAVVVDAKAGKKPLGPKTETPPPTQPAPPPPPAAKNAQEALLMKLKQVPTMISFTSDEKDYTVMLPAKPKREELAMPDNTTIGYSYSEGNKAYRMVRQTYSKPTNRNVQKSLDETSQWLIDSMKGKNAFIRNIKLMNVHHGREFQFTTESGKAHHFRVYQVNNATYMLSVSGDLEFVRGQEANRFLTSFCIMKPPA